jgi:hypothetical protein
MEEKKAAATGADEFAAGRTTFRASQVIEGINAAGGHGSTAITFAHPVLMHEAAELRNLAGFERAANFVAEHPGEVKAVDHGRIARFGESLLLAKQG